MQHVPQMRSKIAEEKFEEKQDTQSASVSPKTHLIDKGKDEILHQGDHDP